ncbi:MAG: RagB/SusD family nutrient uptake outer membrane protein [Chitinophagaceae bacterium]|jgi:hypothetical protein|nr:RagB/SusD family nutrient uptake outer membrane protein [Chitinophagaceae bacterium]
MKKLLTIIFFVSTVLMYADCSKDKLIENSPSLLTADNVYTNFAGFQNGLNGLYDEARRLYSGTLYGNANDLMEEGAVIGVDNAYGNWRSPNEDIFNLWQSYNNASVAYFNQVWTWLYESINAANTILDRANNPSVDWTEDQKNSVVAQARCFRAWFYRHLTYSFGAVPLALHESTSAKTDWERTPVNVIRDSMEADWLFAEQYLPETSSNDGELLKGVAQTYLAELYLAEGNAQKAKEEAQKVTQNSNYALVTQRYGVNKSQPGTIFTDMFIDGNSNRSQGNTEVLWVFQNGLNITGGEGYAIMSRYWINRYYSLAVIGTNGKSANPIAVTADNGGRGIGRLSPTRFAIRLYEKQDDRLSDYAWRWYWIINSTSIPAGYHLGDTIRLDSSSIETLTNANWTNTRKWDYANPINPSATSQYNDLIYLRSSVAWLLLAEADLDLGDRQGAADALNALRVRSNATPVTAGQVTLDYILDERSRELFSEEERRYTLLRTHKWLERTRLYNTIASPNIQDRDTLFPIPQEQVNANVTKPLPQNPGY